MALSRRVFVGAGIAAGASLGAARPAFAATEATLSFGPPSPVYATGPIAMEKGFARDAGVAFRFVPTDAGARSRELLAAGQAKFGHGDLSHPMQLNNRGKKAKVLLATQTVASICEIVVRRDLYDQGITSVEALGKWQRPDGGKPIMAPTSIGSGSWMLGTYIAERRGVGSNFNWVNGGGPKTMLAGLASKQYDAIIGQPSWRVEAERNGFGNGIYSAKTPGNWDSDFGGPIPVLGLYTLDETIESEPELVQGVVEAFYRTMRWVKTASADNIYAAVGEKYYGSTEPDVLKADLTFDRDTSDYRGTITKETFERAGKVWYREGSQIKPIPYENVVDTRFLDAAQKKIG